MACEARDGTVLRADVYRPSADGDFPVLLLRTPYDKSNDGYKAQGTGLAERGYIVVFQDVRGRHASDGEFMPGFYSADVKDDVDGYDAVEWAARLPGSNGRVGTFGNSYDGWTQWELAHTQPPSLKTMFASGIVANLLRRELGGVLRLGRVLTWSVNNLSVDAARRSESHFAPDTTLQADTLWIERDRSKWLWYLPLMDISDEAMPGMGRHWRRWLKDHTSDHFGFEEKHKRIGVPVLSQTGWYDQQVNTIDQFTGMMANGATSLARANQRLIVGPWTHTNRALDRRVGDIDFGPNAVRNFFEIADAWFGKWLKDRQTEADEWPPIQLFVMGANTWRSETEWPLARTSYTDFYLHSGGNANSNFGDGTLSREPPGDEAEDTYVYDPRDPLMTLYTPPGQHEPRDQRALDGRRDLLVYQTAPLEEPIEVTGPITVKLHAATSAPDTDWIAKLIDVWPDGFGQELSHGIVRARYRESHENPTLIEPGRVYEYVIELNPTSNLFREGHRIRVDISSSDFPNFDRNHNVGRNDYEDPELATARQTVLHSSSHPSRIVLPVIP